RGTARRRRSGKSLAGSDAMTPPANTPADLQAQQRQRDRETFGRVLRSWSTAIKNIKLYTPQHPSSQEACQKFVGTLQEAFQQKLEVGIQQTEGLFIIEDMFFIEESLSLYDLLHLLEVRKIEKILFLPGIEQGEVVRFSEFLLVKATDGDGFESPHIRLPAV